MVHAEWMDRQHQARGSIVEGGHGTLRGARGARRAASAAMHRLFRLVAARRAAAPRFWSSTNAASDATNKPRLTLTLRRADGITQGEKAFAYVLAFMGFLFVLCGPRICVDATAVLTALDATGRLQVSEAGSRE